jgi:hypothetical protein
MSIWTEIIEIIVAISPAVFSILLIRKPASHIRSWFIKVVGTAFLAVVAVGMLLMRLTTACISMETQCVAPAQSVPRSPGVFRTCHMCMESAITPVAELLNRRAIDLQALSACSCVLISSFIIIRFMMWARRILLAQREHDARTLPDV